MNTKRAMKWTLFAATAGLALATMPGCELLVTFDRSKIPQEGGLLDGTVSDNSDASTETDTGAVPESSSEASVDSGSSASEASVDSGAAIDGASEASSGDGASEAASDAGVADGASEAAVMVDATPDVVAETGADAGGDSSSEDAPAD